MNTSMACVDAVRLQGLLVAPAGSDERREWEIHLEQCERCRRLLLDVTADAMRNLSGAASQAATIDRQDGNTIDRAAAPVERSKEFDIFDPPRDPSHLGRLAHYELHSVLGRGGMGTVFKAYDEKLQRPVALKMMSLELAASDVARQRFIREARAAAQVTHEHVVAIHAVDESRPVPFLVMQYVEGRSLQDRLRDGPPEIDEVIRIGKEIANGLSAAHARGLVHRDVKPANILLEQPSGRVKLTDFGLARAVDDASLSQSGAVIGTPLFMAPEQARGETVDHRADLFSLGTVLYALCAGASPFRAGNTLAVLRRVCDDQAPSLRALNAAVPAWLEETIFKLMAKDPADRFTSAADVAERLSAGAFTKPMPVAIAPPAPEPVYALPVPPVETKRRWPLYAGGMALLVALGVGIAIWQMQRGSETTAPKSDVRKDKPQANKEEPAVQPTVNINMPGITDLFKQFPFPIDPTEMMKMVPNPEPQSKENPLKPFIDPKPFPFPFPAPPK